MQEINIYRKLIILLYADDTVNFSGSADGLHHALNTFSEYCDKWRLTVNTAKTIIIIFHSRGGPKQATKFTLRGTEIEITNEYENLGIYFSQSGAFASAKNHIAEQANKAVLSLLKNIKRLSLPLIYKSTCSEKKTIKPILLYGCEIWGVGNVDIIEKGAIKLFQTNFWA